LEEAMPLTDCPKCGKFNAFNSLQCPSCGASLDGDDQPKPGHVAGLWALWLEKCVQELWCIVFGIILILLGVFAPLLGSVIIEILLIFAPTNRPYRRSSDHTPPSASDGWWVIMAGLIAIAVGISGLYSAWKKSQTEDLPRQNDSSPES
jgi:hypothetical protein